MIHMVYMLSRTKPSTKEPTGHYERGNIFLAFQTANRLDILKLDFYFVSLLDILYFV